MLIGIDYTSAARQRAGIGRYTRGLVTALLGLDHGHQYSVFAATGGLEANDWRSPIERENVRIRSLPLSDDWLARIWHRLRLPIPVEILTGPVDVFYSPDFALPPTRRGTRTLLTVHDLSFVHHPDAFVPALRRYLERVVPRSLGRADLVLADSRHTRSDLIKLFGVRSDQVKVIYPGADSRFHPHVEPSEQDRLRERYDIGDTPYVLSVGTLQPRKNLARLIQAFARSQGRRHTNAKLLIAGGRGWLYDDILVAANAHDNVRLLGFVEEQNLPTLYRGAALFAFPSLYEGFGLPVLEAMACGVPVICSNRSSLPEVAGEAALLTNPLDVDAMSNAITRALEDSVLRAQMVDRGLAQAANFSWQQSAHQLLSAIEFSGVA